MCYLFSYWFNKAGQQERYYFKTVEVKGEEPGTKEYIAIIIPRNHPQAEEAPHHHPHQTPHLKVSSKLSHS